MFNRKLAEQEARQKLQQSDRRSREEATRTFKNKQGLVAAVINSIIPTLVQIITRNGKRGAGYFQHSEWLLSNSHIIPSKEIIDAGVTVIDYASNSLMLEAESSYHRPSDNHAVSPDIVIVKTNSRERSNHKCLATEFSDDEGLENSYLFYIDFDFIEQQNFKIKFLRRRSLRNTYPLIYECEDGSTPQPGNSGTPIIEARVVLGREPQWQFKVIGVLYARCSSNWYNQSNVVTEPVAENTKLVCAILVGQDFKQILQILYKGEQATRELQMAAACRSLGDAQAKNDARKYAAMGRASAEDQKVMLKKFENGDSPLNISLPEGLEKLWYDGIVSIESSLLIGEVRSGVLGKKGAVAFKTKVPTISEEDLRSDFQGLITKVKKTEGYTLRKMDNFDFSPAGYFRIDVGIGGERQSQWMLDIQDNTGKYKYEKRSLSSVFAKVTLLKSENGLVAGNVLAELFLLSQEKKAPQDIASLNLSRSKPTGKKSKSFANQFSANKNKINAEDLENALNKAFASLGDNDLEEIDKYAIEERALLKEELTKSAAVYGFTCQDVAGDGSCFFHALSDQLRVNGYTLSAEKLREIAIDHILENLSLYEEYIVDISTFIGGLLNRYEWADHIIIQSLSRALNINIAIIRSDNADPNIFRRQDGSETLYIGYEVGIHYQSLHRSSVSQIGKIENVIASADTDTQNINAAVDLLQFKAIRSQKMPARALPLPDRNTFFPSKPANPPVASIKNSSSSHLLASPSRAAPGYSPSVFTATTTTAPGNRLQPSNPAKRKLPRVIRK